MKDSNSIFQITLLKIIILIYFLFIILNSIISKDSFFHHNAEFGFWAMISLFMFSSFILFVDIAIISFVCKVFKNKNKRVYIFIFQSIVSAIVYFGLNYMFENANKWNESTINNNQNISDPNTPNSQKNSN
jgi:amino acid transporter